MTCGFAYVERLLARDQGLQSLVTFWGDQASCNRLIDKRFGEAAVARIYARLKLPLPDVRWWLSPIAMILAHDTLAHGVRWVERHHGMVVMQSSSEYQEWLQSGYRKAAMGKSLGERTCTCDYYGSTLPMLDCLQHEYLCRTKPDPSRLDTTDRLISAYVPAFRGSSKATDGTQIADLVTGFCMPSLCGGWAVRDALTSALSGVLEPNGSVADLAMFQKGAFAYERSCFWAQSRCEDFLRADLQEYFVGGAQRESCLHAYRELARHCHAALLREGVCWLCVDPESMRFDEEVDPYDSLGLCSVSYRDGTQLYCVDGTALSEDAFLSPTSFGMSEIDGTEANPWRRAALLRRYGVKRYLGALNATLIEECSQDQVDKKLWRVTLSTRIVVTFLERSYVDVMGATVFDYHEMPGTIRAVSDGDAYESDDARQVSIFNQPR